MATGLRFEGVDKRCLVRVNSTRPACPCATAEIPQRADGIAAAPRTVSSCPAGSETWRVGPEYLS
jgi:hypothetical protein